PASALPGSPPRSWAEAWSAARRGSAVLVRNVRRPSPPQDDRFGMVGTPRGWGRVAQRHEGGRGATTRTRGGGLAVAPPPSYPGPEAAATISRDGPRRTASPSTLSHWAGRGPHPTIDRLADITEWPGVRGRRREASPARSSCGPLRSDVGLGRAHLPLID